jgi:DNA-binding transcriptional LysR family regulator
LFDRQSRYPKLTEQGKSLLAEARTAVDSVDCFKAKARTLAEGLEPELSVAVDVMYPMAALTIAVGAFKTEFSRTPLRLYVEALGAVAEPVLEGTCRIGVIGSMPEIPKEMSSEKLLDIRMVSVVAPTHALANLNRVVNQRDLDLHVQLVLTDRSSLSQGRSYGVFSPLTWRLADMGAKHEFLKAGFGWGHMPLSMVNRDLKSGDLVKLRIESLEPEPPPLPMFAVYRKDGPPGPAARFFIEQLRQSKHQY